MWPAASRFFPKKPNWIRHRSAWRNRRNLLKLLETPALFSGMQPSGVRVVSGLLISKVRLVRENSRQFISYRRIVMIRAVKSSGGFMRGFTLVALLFAIGTVPAFADIVNGGFEDPNISLTQSQFYLTVDSGQNTITGWSVTGTSVDIVNTIGGSSWAHSGSQAIDLAGTPGPGGVEQSISTTTGVYYDFSFWASSNDSGGPFPKSLVVGWGDNSPIPVNTPGQGSWGFFSYTVKATGSSTTISLSTPISGDFGPLVDDVNVQVHVPEPGSLWGLGAGLVLFLGLVLRPRSA